MPSPITRRRAIAALPAAGVAVCLTRPADAAVAARGEGSPAAFPAQDPALVREIVGASHGNLERVAALLKDAPRLANAAWDWGFGDWETALGAAAHTGRVQIAELLLEHGARIDIFALAMLGRLDAVRAIIEAQPGVERIRGPHGLTLAHHARAGGERAQAVADYLATLPGADQPYTDLPLTPEERALYLGVYRFGPGDDERLEIVEGKVQSPLAIRRIGGVSRALFHQGDHTFHPAGAPEVRVVFRFADGQATGLTIASPAPLVDATRE